MVRQLALILSFLSPLEGGDHDLRSILCFVGGARETRLRATRVSTRSDTREGPRTIFSLSEWMGIAAVRIQDTLKRKPGRVLTIGGEHVRRRRIAAGGTGSLLERP